MDKWTVGKIKIETLLAFGFGVIFVLLLLFLRPQPDQEWNFRTAMSLASAGIAAVIPGMLDIKVTGGKQFAIRATGAIAVFVIVYLINPGQW